MKSSHFILFMVLLTIHGYEVTHGQVISKNQVVKRSTRKLLSNEDDIEIQKKRMDISFSDSEKVNLMNRISHYYSSRDYDSGVIYAEKAYLLASKARYPKGVVTAILRRGGVEELMKKDWNTAIIYYQRALDVARKYELDGMRDDLYSIIHNACVYQGNFPMAMTIAREGLAYAEKRNDRVQVLHYNSLVANSYFRQNLYEQAKSEYLKAEQLAAALERDGIQSLNLVTLPDIHYGLGNLFAAEGDTVLSLVYLEKAHTGFRNLRNFSAFVRGYMIPNTLYKKGLVYHLSGNYDKSLVFALAALDSCNSISCNLYEMVGYYLLAGDNYRLLGDFGQSLSNLLEGKRIAEEIRHAEDIRDACYFLSLFYADQGKYDSAWLYNKRFVILKDSITNERTRFRTEEINALYGIAEKDRKIARQNNQRNILIISFGFFLLTIGFIYSRYRLRQRNQYQRELNRQQNDLFNAISLAQEQERKRIAQDLHDSLGSVLSAAKLKLADLKEELPELTNEPKFISGILLMDEASSELRSISHNIMPATLSKLGLIPALKNLTDSISSNKGLRVSFIAHDFESRMDEQSEISIYRIVLELINNIVKHAAATSATVQLVRYPEYINITVEDNGKGFDRERVLTEKTGIGLGSVQARVGYLKGKMDIDSNPGKGTTVMIEIPLLR